MSVQRGREDVAAGTEGGRGEKENKERLAKIHQVFQHSLGIFFFYQNNNNNDNKNKKNS